MLNEAHHSHISILVSVFLLLKSLQLCELAVVLSLQLRTPLVLCNPFDLIPPKNIIEHTRPAFLTLRLFG